MSHPIRPRCAVCRHPEKWRLELLRAGGVSLDALAEKFGLHRDAIHRHYRDHVSDEMKASFLAGPVALQDLAEKAADAGGSILDHLTAIRVVLSGQMAAMVEAGDGRGAAVIAARLVATLEVMARLTGELGAMASGNITINNTANVAILADHPAFAKLQATMLRALADHPDARNAVVMALRALDAPPAGNMQTIEHHAA